MIEYSHYFKTSTVRSRFDRVVKLIEFNSRSVVVIRIFIFDFEYSQEIAENVFK